MASAGNEEGHVSGMGIRITALVCGSTLLCMLTGCASGGRDMEIRQATDMVFCKPSVRQRDEGGQLFSPTGYVITNRQTISQLVQNLVPPTSDPDYPLIGHLAYMVLRDKAGNPLSLASIVLYDGIVTLHPCERRGENYWVGFVSCEPGARTIRSKGFVRDVYEYMQLHMPAEIQGLDQFYSAKGWSMERLLFDGQLEAQRSRISGSGKR